MTILTIPLIGGGDALGGVEMDNAQFQVEPRTLLVEDLRYSMATMIPDYYFADNRAIRAILLPSTLRIIGRDVFARMESLEEIDLSHTVVETIGEGFLSDSLSVEACRFPSTLRTLSSHCLSRTSIKLVDLLHTLVTALPVRFLSFSPVEVLFVPPSLREVHSNALEGTCLRRLDCSHTRLKQIGYRVLSCSPIVDVRLPATVGVIMFNAFEHSPLRKLWIGEKEVQWVNEHLLDSSVCDLRLPFCVNWINEGSLCRTQLRRVDLRAAEITCIDSNVLGHNPFLQEVLLPLTLNAVSDAFLTHNPHLKFLDLRGTLIDFIADDFLFGTPIEEIWFPDTLGYAGDRFLFGARGTALDLSSTLLTSVGTDFLQQCDQLQTLLLPEWVIDTPDYLPSPRRLAEAIVLPPPISFVGAVFNARAPFLRLMDLSETIVDELPDGFLSDAPNLTDVRLPESLEVIWDNVFARTSLQKVNLLHTEINYIGEGFCEFSPLKWLYVPETYSHKRPELASVIRRPYM